jgi:hypothetical protein
MSFTISLCSAEANGRVLLLWWDLSFKLLGNFLVINLRLFRWGLFVGWRFSVLSKCFLY